MGIKKNSTKTKMKQISKDLISSPQSDVIHSFHVGVTDRKENFGDLTCINNNNDEVINEQTTSLFDEVMQAFTEIYSETPSDDTTG